MQLRPEELEYAYQSISLFSHCIEPQSNCPLNNFCTSIFCLLCKHRRSRRASRDAGTWRGAGGAAAPINLKDCLGKIANCQKYQCNYFTNLLQKMQEMQSSSFKNSTIAWRRTPSHPINRKHDLAKFNSRCFANISQYISIQQCPFTKICPPPPMPSHRSGVPACISIQ